MANISGWNFDWDDNIFFMPTKILLYQKSTGAEKAVSTEKFAEVKSLLGKRKSDWEDYEVRPTKKRDHPKSDNSFKYFRDGTDGSNYFRDDIVSAVDSNDPESWVGPSWEAFVFALSHPETAKHVTIITARGHSRCTMTAGLSFLHARGYFRYLPPEENIYPVSNPELGGNAEDPSGEKVRCMKGILDQIEATPLQAGAPTVMDRDGGPVGADLHLWGFSDDDWDNVRAALEGTKGTKGKKGKKGEKGLPEGVEGGLWPNIKVTVFYTGPTPGTKKHPRPKCQVITSSGGLRERHPDEIWEGVLTTLGASTVAAGAPDPSPRARSLNLYDPAVFRALHGV